jgi:hypothetical protein
MPSLHEVDGMNFSPGDILKRKKRGMREGQKRAENEKD